MRHFVLDENTGEVLCRRKRITSEGQENRGVLQVCKGTNAFVRIPSGTTRRTVRKKPWLLGNPIWIAFLTQVARPGNGVCQA